MCTPSATPLEIAPRLRLWPANAAASNPARPVQFLTISAIESVSIGLANPVAVGYRLSLSAPRNTRWRQAPDPPEQRALGDRRGGEPGLERCDRTEIGAPLRQP